MNEKKQDKKEKKSRHVPIGFLMLLILLTFVILIALLSRNYLHIDKGDQEFPKNGQESEPEIIGNKGDTIVYITKLSERTNFCLRKNQEKRWTVIDFSNNVYKYSLSPNRKCLAYTYDNEDEVVLKIIPIEPNDSTRIIKELIADTITKSFLTKSYDFILNSEIDRTSEIKWTNDSKKFALWLQANNYEKYIAVYELYASSSPMVIWISPEFNKKESSYNFKWVNNDSINMINPKNKETEIRSINIAYN